MEFVHCAISIVWSIEFASLQDIYLGHVQLSYVYLLYLWPLFVLHTTFVIMLQVFCFLWFCCLQGFGELLNCCQFSTPFTLCLLTLWLHSFFSGVFHLLVFVVCSHNDYQWLPLLLLHSFASGVCVGFQCVQAIIVIHISFWRTNHQNVIFMVNFFLGGMHGCKGPNVRQSSLPNL